MTQAATKTESNTHRALRELRNMIFSGKLAAGTDHLETELADKLGMSRTPVREATLTLESQGLLEVRPRKGVRILPIAAEDMREIYELLTELESLAAEKAAAKNLSDQKLSGLKNAIETMEAAIDKEDLEGWAFADEQFHEELVRLSGNERLMTIVGMMSDQVKRARMATLYLRPVPTKSNEDHRAVYAAIKRGDAKNARILHNAHRKDAGRTLVELLERHRISSI